MGDQKLKEVPASDLWAALLQDKIALVTGAYSGIGRAVSELFAAQGAQVIAIDRDQTILSDPPSGAFRRVQCDITQPGQLAEVSSLVGSDAGHVDILVNSAGVAIIGSAMDVSVEDWDRTFDVDVRGAWLMCRLAIPFMPRGAAIVNVASASGLRPLPGLAAYSAAKAALISLTRSLAVELGDLGIRANCVCPGMVDTPMNDSVLDARFGPERDWSALLEPYAIKRVADPGEVAAAITFLASDLSSFVTGVAMPVDGGRSLH